MRRNYFRKPAVRQSRAYPAPVAPTLIALTPLTSNLASFIVIVLIALIIWRRGRNRRHKLRVSRGRFDVALSRLRESPTDAEAKQEALNLGNEYIALNQRLIGFRRVPFDFYDQAALMDEIEAATTGRNW